MTGGIRRCSALAFIWATAVVCNPADAVPIDRAVVRFVASETGGNTAPRFIFERELAFEARLEALSDPSHEYFIGDPYRPRHVRAAMERHVAETLLESLTIDPEPTEREMSARIEAARLAWFQRAGGVAAVEEALAAEAFDRSEFSRLLRRQARASLYLDRMVSPMLAPTQTELLSAYRTLRTPFSNKPFDEVRDELERWYTTLRLTEALGAFYDGARSRLRIVTLH